MQKKWVLLIISTILCMTITVGTVLALDISDKDIISNEGQQHIEKRLNLLEFALVSQSPEEVANTWAKGVMTRNGALQYAVLCDNLKSKYKSEFEALNWYTGTSSPWVESYQINTIGQHNDGSWEFSIRFHYSDSTKASYSSVVNILVSSKKVNGAPLPERGTDRHWCVTKIETSQPLQKD